MIAIPLYDMYSFEHHSYVLYANKIYDVIRKERNGYMVTGEIGEAFIPLCYTWEGGLDLGVWVPNWNNVFLPAKTDF